MDITVLTDTLALLGTDMYICMYIRTYIHTSIIGIEVYILYKYVIDIIICGDICICKHEYIYNYTRMDITVLTDTLALLGRDMYMNMYICTYIHTSIICTDVYILYKYVINIIVCVDICIYKHEYTYIYIRGWI